MTTSFGGETALSLTRQLAASVKTPATLSAADVRARIRSVLAIDDAPGGALPSRTLGRIKKPGYRAEYFEFTSDREIRIPGWLLTPDNATASTPTVLYLGEGSTWGSVAEEAFAERLCARGGCRVAAIDVRGRGDLSIAYPQRGRHYFPNRIPNEGYLTWFTMWLGKPLIGGQVFDVLRALDYLRSRSDVPAETISLMGDGPHGVLALFAGALDDRVRRVALATDDHGLSIARGCRAVFSAVRDLCVRAPEGARPAASRERAGAAPCDVREPGDAHRRAVGPRGAGAVRGELAESCPIRRVHGRRRYRSSVAGCSSSPRGLTSALRSPVIPIAASPPDRR